MHLVIASIILILFVGILIELVFRPVEARVLRNRGLPVDR